MEANHQSWMKKITAKANNDDDDDGVSFSPIPLTFSFTSIGVRRGVSKVVEDGRPPCARATSEKP
jgi:hypothetical protein